MFAAEDALSFGAGLDERAFLASDPHQSAVIRKFEIMGEAERLIAKLQPLIPPKTDHEE